MSVIEVPVTTTAPTVGTWDVYHRAADLLGEFDWCQKSYGSRESGRMCATTAICIAAEDLGVGDHEACYAFNARFADWLGYGLTLGWNDKPGRTKAEVVAKLREAAEAIA